jgi:anti-sigma-K factor RskA
MYLGAVVMNTNEHVLDLIPTFALDSLDQEEEDYVRQHLAGCTACQDELRAFEDVAAEISSVIPQTAPPTSLRARLLESVQHPYQQEKTFPAPVSGPSLWQRLQMWRVSALAVVSLILVLAVSNILLWQQVNTLRGEITDTNMIVHPLYSVNVETNSTGLVVMDPQGDFGTVIVDSLPPAGERQYYQVWLSRVDQIDSGGVLDVHDNGYGAKVIYASFPLHTYTRIWVTIEPEEDSEQPTGKVVLQTSP